MIPYEETIETLDLENSEVVLTTHRLRENAKLNNSTRVTSIMLDELSFCQLHYRDHVMLAIFAVIIFIGSVIAGGQIDPWYYLGTVIPLILLFFYLNTRGGFITFGSSGGQIVTRRIKKSIDYTLSFIEKVETAKNARSISTINYPTTETINQY